MKNITRETEEKLARSLSWETTELLPFLPYLLQDFWELGSDPDVMTELIEKYAGASEKIRILDLACGKGAAGSDVLGGPAEALNKLKATVKPGGCILIEVCP